MIQSVFRDTVTNSAISLPFAALLTAPTLQNALVNLVTTLVISLTRHFFIRRKAKRLNSDANFQPDVS